MRWVHAPSAHRLFVNCFWHPMIASRALLCVCLCVLIVCANCVFVCEPLSLSSVYVYSVYSVCVSVCL